MKESEGIPLGTVVGGRYRVRERLGEGGMGSVYTVEHVHTGQELALKVLNAKMVADQVALERFRRESRAPARIQSDHVVQVTDADVAPELGGAPFLVMELLRGESFDQMLSDRPTLPPAEALSYLQQIARALDKAHSLGIVHRDIKPENLFLTRREDGTPCVKLLDFGIAKLTEAHEGATASKTATGAIFGTPLYMAPEQILGQPDKISGQTDIWALGVMAHKMLVGREPWSAQTLPHLVAQIAYEPIPAPSARGSSLGPGFDAWFSRCCARQPEDRFRTAMDAVVALGQALGTDLGLPTSSVDLSRSAAGSARVFGAASSAPTVAAGAASAIGSDTLAAQVTPKKSSGKVVVVAAAFAVLGLILGGIWVATRGANAKEEHAVSVPKELTVAAPPKSVEPLVEPTTAGSIAPPVSAEPLPSASTATPGKTKTNSSTTKPKPKPGGGSEDPLLDTGRK